MTNDGNEHRETLTDTTTNEERSLTMSRVIEVSPDRVYEAFLDPNDLAAWLPPDGFSAEVHEFEGREGGTFRISFTADTDELEEYASTFHGTYEELIQGERIVYTEAFETDDPGMTGEMTTTVTFEAVPDGTEITLRQAGIPENIPVENAREGWTNSLDNLESVVQGP
jgi:uncharacterized protein YndB with AHSA1/START domain